jgi:NADH:quinone reductase (non-electrogenic)
LNRAAAGFQTRITELFGNQHPILCGGLIWLADARYVAAAVNAGCMAFITALSFPDDPESFRAEIRKCRELTCGKPFGVSLAFSDRSGVNDRLAPYVRIAVEERVRFVETSGGNPAQFVCALKDGGCIVMHRVPADRYALSAQRLGVDAIAVVGGEAGGHQGVYMTGNMVQAPLAADAVTLPLAIGGGMGTARHLVTTLAMGADAMLLGSRMLVAAEIWGHERYKQRVIEANERDNRVVMKIFRNNHRVLDNDAARAVEELEVRGIADYEAYRALASGRNTRRAYETGDVAQGLIDLGPAAVFTQEIRPVEDIVDQVIDDAVAALERLRALQKVVVSRDAWPQAGA